MEQLDEQRDRSGPDALAGQNGLPASTRDQQNRRQLAQTIKLLEAAPPSSDRDTYLARARSVQAMLDDPGAPAPTYLLGLDIAKGHAAVAYGNPDTAANTAVFVPGTGVTLDGIQNEGSAKHLHRQTERRYPGTSLSTVMWLGYDAPPSVQQATTPGRAINGAEPLDNFLHGLRSTHQGPPTDLTLIGHSYGSETVGEAALRDQLPVDNVVLVGSPGSAVDSASQFHVPAGHVYAAANTFDLVRIGGDVGGLPMDVVEGQPITALPVHGLIGADPTDPRFGAHLFSTGGPFDGATGSAWMADHSYFDPNSRSLENMSAIVAGDPQDVG